MTAPRDYQFLRLATKPEAQLSYSFSPAAYQETAGVPPLVVFVNGLGRPQAAWTGVIANLLELRHDRLPAMLTYDRFGQGQTTDRDPQDKDAPDPSHAHDCMSAVADLRQLITQIALEKLGVTDVNAMPIVFVGNSIGCALIRLYTQEHPGTVAGVLFLDSVLANSDFVSTIPDPDASDFDTEEPLPAGITAEDLRMARGLLLRTFHPKNGSAEGLSRKNLKDLLPDSDGPRLTGTDDRGPLVTVIGHDFEAFADEATKMGMPRAVTVHYTNPHWHKYNQGLAKLTDPERSLGPLQAPGTGHFIQVDNPAFVADELNKMLERL